jgi:hypothetical protein
MTMPKTAMYENNLLPACENEIGFAGDESTMQPIAITQAVNELPDRHLRSRVFPPDKRHPVAALLLREGVHHVSEMPARQASY